MTADAHTDPRQPSLPRAFRTTIAELVTARTESSRAIADLDACLRDTTDAEARAWMLRARGYLLTASLGADAVLDAARQIEPGLRPRPRPTLAGRVWGAWRVLVG
jgi:hypothetical protein